jgi:hypothetical protein
MGELGNLSSGEIVEQLMHAAAHCDPAQLPIRNMVFMGMGALFPPPCHSCACCLSAGQSLLYAYKVAEPHAPLEFSSSRTPATSCVTDCALTCDL